MVYDAPFLNEGQGLKFGVATFNLYCCRERPEWPWAERLGEMIGATDVSVRSVRRAADEAQAHAAGGGEA